MKHANEVEVVLVDDSEIVRERVVSALSAIEGIGPIREAGTMDAGRDLLRNGQPGIVILDVDLAGQNGIDLLSFVNRQAHPMVIMLSNYDLPKLRARCLELGASYYCYKVTEFERVLELSREFVRHRQPEPSGEREPTAALLDAARVLEEREERYRALFERSLDCLFVLDLQGRMLDANAAALKLMDYTREDIGSLTIASLVEGGDLNRAHRAIGEIIQKGASQTIHEFEIKRKDGNRATIEVQGSLIVREGRPYGIQGIARDITERKHSEAEIQRLTRLYAVLSHVNHTLIRAATKEELFRQVCEIAVETAGFKAVVIGWPDRATKQVIPVAQAGAPLANFQNPQVYMDERPQGLGPTGTAIREGRICVVNDIETDPRMTIWLDIAQAVGVKSVGSFPIRLGGKIYGTMSLYASEVGVFQEREVSLLATVAENISSGLDRLEQAARKQQAEEELKAREESYRVVLRETGQIAYDYNVATGAIAWNGAIEGVLGYTWEEMQQITVENWREHIHPIDREQVAAITDKAIQRRNRYHAEYRIRHKDGTYVYVEERGSFFAGSKGKTDRMLGTVTNITERHEIEEQIREQARLLDLAHDAILVLDLEDKILYWNSSAERIYGWTAEEALGRNAAELLQQDTHITSEARQALLAREDWTGELTHLTRAGQNVLVEARLTLVRDRHGLPKSILSINTDITERKKLETQFLRTQRMESIGTLANGIAHDLNNVLAPIMMATQLLDSDQPGEDRKRLLNLISSSAQRGADLVRQVVAFCRGMEGRRIRLHAGAVIRELHHILSETLPKSIQIRLKISKDLWPVMADPTQIYQVLLNLCVNARDAMPQGGILTISAENVMATSHPSNSQKGENPTPHLLLLVSDTGTGIPLEIQEKIFDPFFTTKEPGHGTGLGLSTTLGIVKSHRGAISLYSEPGRGSAFKVYLPAHNVSAAAALKQEEIALPRGNEELIMIVDDEASIRTIATQTLQTYGYQVITAKDGAEALNLYATHGDKVAVLLVDMMMPVMDGLTAIEALKHVNPAIKVIAASGLSPESHGLLVSHSMIKAFLPKPYGTRTLLETLNTVLGHQPPRSPVPIKPNTEVA